METAAALGSGSSTLRPPWHGRRPGLTLTLTLILTLTLTLTLTPTLTLQDTCCVLVLPDQFDRREGYELLSLLLDFFGFKALWG